MDFSSLPRIPDTVKINGATLCASGLIDILNMVTNPLPGRWYRFERQGEEIVVHTKQDESMFPLFIKCSECGVAAPEQDQHNANRHAVNCKLFRRQKQREYFGTPA